MQKIVTGIVLTNLPEVAMQLYRHVIGEYVKISDDLLMPLSRGIPQGEPIAEIILTPTERGHRQAYRAILRDAVARRIRQLGGKVQGKYVELCKARLLFDITISGDHRILTVFPLGDVDAKKAISTVERFAEILKYIEIGLTRIPLGYIAKLDFLRGGEFPEPMIEILDEDYNRIYVSDPIKTLSEGKARAIEGGEDFDRKARIHLLADSEETLKKLEAFVERFLHGHKFRQGYVKLMRTDAEIASKSIIEKPSDILVADRGEIAIVVYSKEDPELYRSLRRLSISRGSVIHMIRPSSLEEFIASLEKKKPCGLAALAVDIHKKLGFIAYKLPEMQIKRLFGTLPKVIGVTSYQGKYIIVKYYAYGRFLESGIEEDISKVIDSLPEGAIVYSQGVRELSRRDGAILYLDRKTSVGIIENNEPARGSYFFTPWDAYVVTGYNCRALRIRFIRLWKYKAYALALYTYRSSRLLQRDFPILVPPAIRALDRIREHITHRALPSKGKRRKEPRFL